MDAANPVHRAKAELRAIMQARRSAIPAAARAAGAGAVARQGIGFLDKKEPLVVSGFLAIGDEIDPALLLARLSNDGCQLALPVMVGRTQPLQFRLWRPGDALRTVQWGIREPLESAPALVPDLLLVPLLAFDRRGHRLGYGGGYYDRTLAGLRQHQSPLAVGLAFDEQEVDAVPHLDYDQRLDRILTPSGPIRCHA